MTPSADAAPLPATTAATAAASPRGRLLDDPRVRAEVVGLLYRNAATGVVMNLLSVPLVWLAYRAHLPARPLAAVLFAWSLLQLLSAWNRSRWTRLAPTVQADPAVSRAFLFRAWLMALVLSVGIAGVVGVLHFAELPAASTLAASLALIYVLGASVSTLIYVPQVVTFSLVVLGSQAALLAAARNPAEWLLAVLLGLVVVGLWSYSRRYGGQLQQLIVLRFQVQDLVAERESQRNAAEAANLAKSRFFAAASHDVRQPLQAVMLTFHALKHAKTPERQLQLIDSIEQNLGALRQLFDQVLDISRIDAGAVPIRRAAVPLQAMFDRLDQRFGVEAGAKRIWLRFAPTRAFVDSDPDALERMLSNLVGNAIKHTERGGVWVGLRRSRGRIEVRDSGIGIAPEDHAQIFEEFFQVGNAARDRAGGLGLGLSIVRRLSALLGHRVALASAPGRGSTFWIEVPLVDGGASAPSVEIDTIDRSGPVPLGGDAAGRLAGAEVTLIENDPPILAALVELLSDHGARVRGFVSAESALDDAARNPAAGVIVTDYRLGGSMDGVEAVQRLRARWDRGVPAIVLTGDTAVRDLTRIDTSLLHAEREPTRTLLLHKPVTAARLVAEIHALVQTAAA